MWRFGRLGASHDPIMETSDDNRVGRDAPIRGEIRAAGFRRVSHGLFLPLAAGLGQDAEFLRELRAWQLVLPPSAVFTHITGAHLLGWQLPNLPEQVPVFAAVNGDDSRPRRPGLICSRLVREHVPDGTVPPLEQPEEILLRAGRDFGTLDLAIMLDSARRLGQISPARMDTVLSSRRPGVRALSAAWAMSSAKADSATETVLRIFHQAIDVPVTPQATLFDRDGRVVGQADLLVDGTRFVHEYDGADHRDKQQQRTDLRRDRGLDGAHYVRRGFTLDDLLNYPLVVMHEIDRALDRPHRLSRLNRWRRLVENSLYSPVGRERVLNRWRRLMGVADWSRTA